MSNKFTAGPWRAEGMDIMGEWEDGESITIANCGATRFCGDESGGPKDKRMKAENIGNAALISAAPEMYHALTDLCRFIKMGDKAGFLAFAHAYENAIKAIKKAEDRDGWEARAKELQAEIDKLKENK